MKNFKAEVSRASPSSERKDIDAYRKGPESSHTRPLETVLVKIENYTSIAHWLNCSSDNIMRVFKLQKRAARVILEADTRSNSVKHFKKLAWLPFYDEVKLNKSILVFFNVYKEAVLHICTIHSN